MHLAPIRAFVRALRLRALAPSLALLAATASAAPAHAAGFLGLKLDPALAAWVAGGAEPRTIWVGFSGKSPRGPADAVERLARAEAGLTSASRARRLRAGVRPLVDERDVPVAPEYLESLRALGLEPFAVSRWLNRAAVRVTPERVESIARLSFVTRIGAVVRRAPGSQTAREGATITRARPAGEPTARGAGSATLFGSAPAPGISGGQLAQIGVTALHDAGYTGAGVKIVIMDQGFNFHWKHDATRNIALPPGYRRDFVDGDTTVADTTDLFNFRHGTWILGALGGNLPGVYMGSAYDATFALARTEIGASEIPVEMLYWAQAAEWADSLGVDIISSSVGYNTRFDDPFPDIPAEDMDGGTTDISRAAQIAASKGILLVNSIGNDGFGPLPRIAAPADVHGDSLIAVGAVDTFGNVSSFSSRGPTSDGRIKPDLVARGTAAWVVHATGLPSAYQQQDGTSFAAPLVAGLAACLMQARPTLSAVEVIRALRETASAMCLPDLNQGWGIPYGPAALAWIPGPAGVKGAPTGYLELANTGPNPIRRATGPLQLRFGLGSRLGERADARLRVFDAQGRLVRGLFYGSMTCGRWQSVEWNGRDQEDRAAGPGVYFVHFDAEGRTRTLRVALLE